MGLNAALLEFIMHQSACPGPSHRATITSQPLCGKYSKGRKRCHRRPMNKIAPPLSNLTTSTIMSGVDEMNDCSLPDTQTRILFKKIS